MSLAKLLLEDEYQIDYPGIADVELDDKGKPKNSWMKDWDQEQRTEKFFEFCREYDLRRDFLLKENYQQFSHRLHWHECPFVDEMRQEKDRVKLLEGCIIFSFTNEHWQTFRAWKDDGVGAMKVRFATQRHARSDLFQIYYPKDTDVKKWLLDTPRRAAIDLDPLFDGIKRPYTMMEFAKKMNEHFVKHLGFRNAMYPSKNAARHIAMSHPELVDPDSFLHGGTGYFDGLSQVFDCPHLMSKSKYDIDEDGNYVPMNKYAKMQVEFMDYLKAHPKNPIHTHQYLNLEDKLCMHYKYMSMRFGVKQQTKMIPYNWVYPDNWSLKTNRYDRHATQ